MLARDKLWEFAANQHGYVTIQQAAKLGINKGALTMLAQRGTINRATFGVYRLPNFPYSAADRLMLAVLWTRAPEAALSHETALDLYEISDINPSKYHITIAKGRRLRRADSSPYAIHYENLDTKQIGWWEGVPSVKPATAIAQCIDYGTPTHLIRQALERGFQQGRITQEQREELATRLAQRDG
ncbi:type IV toxin-antitoxin system AbiEi family antitoxin domain-containing protein [Candidatus Aquiluna sp. UB-MaderosW2red]|uniref:type IV toxin-antitoxin system AbiEi family antitoxin domain-containing protein n=1 Tax=Candidatus Aquiluna sp. UB-MaderosW2red TaxID=1855377 RepID=UPI000875C882|nr:type IV toxin-antitoxin system AbiEi family antitoxin domain-containing protein [Candidatus Aquiluna sp. UB-MaderosW2red]SCX05462.1 Transcriptional regulator, AbiEi antitoxin, Type IV TA system [Candidatus Aquiluna sp. UB-MaderosW2red]